MRNFIKYIICLLSLCFTLDLIDSDVYDNSWALIIGINKYDNVRHLNYALDDVNVAANKYWDHENFYLIVFGDKDSTATFLNQFDNVEMLHHMDAFK